MSDTEFSPGDVGKVPPPARTAKPSMFRDPVVRTLAFVAVGLVVLYLITVASALVLGVLGARAPQTSVQRDINKYEGMVEQDGSDAVVWRLYAESLIASGELARAQQVVDRAMGAVDEKAGMDITTAQAKIYFASERYEETIELCDQIMTSLTSYHEGEKAKDDTPESRGAEISENYYSALLMKVESLVVLDRNPEAIALLDTYLADRPAAADIFQRRGDLRAEEGDVAGAEEDYRAALRYLPGDPALLDALERIGVDE